MCLDVKVLTEDKEEIGIKELIDDERDYIDFVEEPEGEDITFDTEPLEPEFTE